ncbi:ATP-dependent RNA helicase DeaD [Jiangella sp. DSM 45060]|nr:ATP-dependent RNA helicase DeaD [Jiangella sp. DSM 45060]
MALVRGPGGRSAARVIRRTVAPARAAGRRRAWPGGRSPPCGLLVGGGRGPADGRADLRTVLAGGWRWSAGRVAGRQRTWPGGRAPRAGCWSAARVARRTGWSGRWLVGGWRWPAGAAARTVRRPVGGVHLSAGRPLRLARPGSGHRGAGSVDDRCLVGAVGVGQPGLDRLAREVTACERPSAAPAARGPYSLPSGSVRGSRSGGSDASGRGGHGGSGRGGHGASGSGRGERGASGSGRGERGASGSGRGERGASGS